MFRFLRLTHVSASLLLSVVFCLPALSARERRGQPDFTALYVLGDSLSDTGRTAAVIPEALRPLSLINGRFSNGPLWPEYAAPALGFPYSALDNYAWAGATSGRTNIFPGLPGVTDEVDELLSDTLCRGRLDRRAAYVLFAGSNDFLQILSGTAAPEVVLASATDNLVALAKKMQRRGARHLVIVDLPDIGLTPRAQAAGLGSTASALSVSFNALLKAKLAAARVDYTPVSAFGLLRAVVAAPASFGFTNVTTPGILNLPASGSYLFWDDIHPSTRMHALLAEEIVSALVRTPQVCR